MQEAHIDHSEIDRLVEKLEQAPLVIKEAKRQAFEAAAPKLQAVVQSEIGGDGRVRNWQEAYVGSKGGYAAVRPRAKTYAESRGPQTFEERKKEPHPTYAVSYITNAINNGHRTRQNKWGYRTSGKTIQGKQFYQPAQGQVEQVAQEAAGQIVQALTEHLGG